MKTPAKTRTRVLLPSVLTAPSALIAMICSVSCGTKQASCAPGQEVPGGSTICLQGASCTCQ